jgi:hypothetical protein
MVNAVMKIMAHAESIALLPVLYREGLVRFCSDVKGTLQWYSVMLTPEGTMAAVGAQTRKDRGL